MAEAFTVHKQLVVIDAFLGFDAVARLGPLLSLAAGASVATFLFHADAAGPTGDVITPSDSTQASRSLDWPSGPPPRIRSLDPLDKRAHTLELLDWARSCAIHAGVLSASEPASVIIASTFVEEPPRLRLARNNTSAFKPAYGDAPTAETLRHRLSPEFNAFLAAVPTLQLIAPGAYGHKVHAWAQSLRGSKILDDEPFAHVSIEIFQDLEFHAPMLAAQERHRLALAPNSASVPIARKSPRL